MTTRLLQAPAPTVVKNLSMGRCPVAHRYQRIGALLPASLGEPKLTSTFAALFPAKIHTLLLGSCYERYHY